MGSEQGVQQQVRGRRTRAERDDSGAIEQSGRGQETRRGRGGWKGGGVKVVFCMVDKLRDGGRVKPLGKGSMSAAAGLHTVYFMFGT